MDHSFVVNVARFHRTEPNIYMLQGYFTDNTLGSSRISAFLDGRELAVETGIRQGLAVRQKYFAKGIGLENIDREYDLWIHLPEGWDSVCAVSDGRGRLRIVQKDGRKAKVIYRAGTARLLKERAWIDGYLETFRADDKKVCIGGWAVADAACRFRVYDGNGDRLEAEVTRHFRQDILDNYPEIDQPDGADEAACFGYEVSFDKPATRRITLAVGTKRRQSLYRLDVEKGLGKGMKIPMVQKAAAYFKRYGLARTVKRVGQKVSEKMTGEREGYMTWRKHTLPSKEELAAQREHHFEREPLFSIVVPLYRTDEKLLRALVESVRAQTYANWELCLSDGSGEPSPLTPLLQEFEKSDSRIRAVSTGQQLGIAQNTNQALSAARGEFIAFADHDDLLPAWALYECAREINEHPGTQMIYSDEDKITMNGKEFFQPHFKSDFNIDLLTSMNYFCHLVVVCRELLVKVRLDGQSMAEAAGPLGDGIWFDPAFDGAQDYDFVLRCVEQAGEEAIRHIPKVLYHWRSHPASTSENPESKRYAFEAGMRAVQAHFDRIGVPAQVSMGAYPGLYRVKYIIPQPEPLVSIIIPNKDHAQDLEKCVTSILERSSYRNFEFVIVENGSQTQEIFDCYERLKARCGNFTVLTWEEGFNYSAINNFGVTAAKGDYFLFLNNDTEMTDPDLIAELVGPCLRQEVGAVGARLFYEDGTIQHAGVIIGYGGIAGHAFQGMGGSENGYFSRIICQSDLSAVTAACMLVKRSAFEAAGGFDPVLAVAFNDIDLCLKIRREGYLVVYNPFAVMTHYESKSRGMEDTPGKIARFNKEADVLLRRWADILRDGDPYYNPNLSLDRVDFGLKKF